MEDLEDLKQLVLQLLRGIWRNRWLALVIAFPLMITGMLYVDNIKDRYTAQTKVYIDTSSVLKPLLKGLAIQSDFQSNVRLMVRQLLSRPNLERSVRLMDMDIDVESPEELEKLIENVRGRVNISAKRGTSTYTISYSDTNRERAKKMVQTLLDIFVEDTLGKSVNESDDAITFLDNQIAKYEKLLQDAEQRRESFKRKNVGLMPKDGANYYGQLQEVNSQLEVTLRLLDEAKNRRNKLKSQLDSLVFSKNTNLTSSSYDERIREQEVRLEDLLLLYTEEHPDVINTKRILKSLNNKRDKELDKLKSEGQYTITDNPVQQELQILLSQTEADISSLVARIRSFREKQAEVKKLVDIVPKIEAELQRLDRDYNVHKGNYTELVKRREQALISDDVESGTEQVKFRIIEPPFVPFKPDYPNRVLFDLAVLVLSLGAGYGVGFLLSLLKPVFYNINDLRNYTEFAILGAVNKFDTVDVLSKRKKNLVLFSLTNLLFISFAMVIIVIHSQGIAILSYIKTVVPVL